MVRTAFPQATTLKFSGMKLLTKHSRGRISEVCLTLSTASIIVSHTVGRNTSVLVARRPLLFSTMGGIASRSFVAEEVIGLVRGSVSCCTVRAGCSILNVTRLSKGVVSLRGKRILSIACASRRKGPRKVKEVNGLRGSVALRRYYICIGRELRLKDLGMFKSVRGGMRHLTVSPKSKGDSVTITLRGKTSILMAKSVNRRSKVSTIRRKLTMVSTKRCNARCVFVRSVGRFFRGGLPILSMLASPVRRPFRVVWSRIGTWWYSTKRL